jgi:hypothetical protein
MRSKVKFKEVEDYADPTQGFWGFGDTLEAANIIFIGPELGGGKCSQEVRERIEVWREMGSRNVLDGKAYHDKAFGAKDERNCFHTGHQPTYNRLMLSLPESEKPLENYLCPGAGTAFIDLSPLPCSSLSSADFNCIYDFGRVVLKEKLLLPRAKWLSEFVLKNSTRKLFVFYGSHKSHWDSIVLTKWRKINQAIEQSSSFPQVFCIRHPANRFNRASNKHYSALSALIMQTQKNQSLFL